MAVHFTTPDPNTRPSTVTSAVVIAYIVLATTIAVGITNAYMFSLIIDAARDAIPADQLSPDEAETVETGIVILTFILYLLAFAPALWAIGIGICAPFVAKGRNGARVTTWVFSGVGICCGALGLPIGGQAVLDTGGDPEMERQLAEAMEAIQLQIPAWVADAQLAGAIAILVGYIAIVVLLALPKSNDYFRKPANGQPTQFLDI